MSSVKTENKVPIWEKLNLTVEEASEYSNIGVNKIRELSQGMTGLPIAYKDV